MITQIDFAILNWIQAHLQCTFCDIFWALITKFGDGGIFWIVMCIVLTIFPKTRKLGITMLITLGMCFIAYHFVLKGMIGRLRPYQQNPDFKILISEPSGSSFPSGHSASAFCMAALLFLFRKREDYAKKIWIPVTVLAVLIAFSRLYLYVHFPTDVIAGILCGIIFALVGFLISIKIQKKMAK